MSKQKKKKNGVCLFEFNKRRTGQQEEKPDNIVCCVISETY